MTTTGGGGRGAAGYATVMIVPTGIGASIGGFAGDALPAAKLLATVSDKLITHPNVMNGAMMYWPVPNIEYVEGYALDEFAAKRFALQPLAHGAHRIGLLLDSAIEANLRDHHLLVANAARATLGIDVSHCVVTRKSLGVHTLMSSRTGASWGSLDDPESLLEAGRELKARGCTAIAVVARFPEVEDQEEEDQERFAQYLRGEGVDGIAGAEALISHILTKELKIPCAHAPAFAISSSCSSPDVSICPKAAAEEIGYTFLPCVLSYLHRAPKLLHCMESLPVDAITADDVQAVVTPYNALGGPTVLSFLSQGKLVLAVQDNVSSMRVAPSQLPKAFQDRVIVVRSYAEAAGLIAAHKAGILLDSLRPKISTLDMSTF
eukprot:gene500-539_t